MRNQINNEVDQDQLNDFDVTIKHDKWRERKDKESESKEERKGIRNKKIKEKERREKVN